MSFVPVSPSVPSSTRSTCWLIPAVLCLVYGCWYLAVWPGPLGPDGYSLLVNIHHGTEKATGKDPAWLMYAMAMRQMSSHHELIVIPMLLVHVLIWTRLLGFLHGMGRRKTAWALLVLGACTPHVLTFASGLYADSVFSLAFIALLFEAWLMATRRTASVWTLAYVALLLPIGGFFKANGVVIALPLLYAAWRLVGWRRWWLIAIVLIEALAIRIAAKELDLGEGHGALHPLVLYETVNFMQTRPMGLPETAHMVTVRTQRLIYRYTSQEAIDRYYDRDYWDTIWHQNFDHFHFRGMSEQEQQTLLREFLKYNVWRNLPAFVSSRVNIFLASALAQGGMVLPADARGYLPLEGATTSRYNPFNLKVLPHVADRAYAATYNWRYLFWTPFIGIALIFVVWRKARRRHDMAARLVALTLMIQLAAIVVFSIAAEYRYLLMFFYAPAALIPISLSLGGTIWRRPAPRQAEAVS